MPSIGLQVVAGCGLISCASIVWWYWWGRKMKWPSDLALYFGCVMAIVSMVLLGFYLLLILLIGELDFSNLTL